MQECIEYGRLLALRQRPPPSTMTTGVRATDDSPEPDGAEVHVWKARQSRWGVRGRVANLAFDQITGRFA